MIRNRSIALFGAVAALAALLAAPAAHARVDWSVNIGVPGVVVPPEPVYYPPPAPVYVPPPPVYYRPPPPVYYRPPPVYYRPPPPVYYGPGYYEPRWRHRHRHWRDWDD